jgi:putative spermidine/putrescine transport system permease protein
MPKRRGLLSWITVAIYLALMILPVVAVALNAVGTTWAGTVLPEGYSAQWMINAATDPRFTAALINSVVLASGTLVVSAFVCVPAILVAHCYFPALDRWLAALVVLPYAVPGIVLALGLLRLYSGNYGIQLNGSPWVLVFGYIPLGASFYYVPIKSNLRALAVAELFEAGALVGASDFAIMRRVILPSIARGLVVGLVMNFTLVISEFVYANLLVGSFFPTLQIFMNVIRAGSGHLTSVVVTAYFLVVWIATSIVAAMLMPPKERS